jgi:putative FmdB family regulatory protein
MRSAILASVLYCFASAKRLVELPSCFALGRVLISSEEPSSKKKRAGANGSRPFLFRSGDPREIRTPDRSLRRRMLYPAELWGHVTSIRFKPRTSPHGNTLSWLWYNLKKMPIFEYRCKACQSHFEEIRKVSEKDEKAPCPKCASPETERLLSRFAVSGQGDQRESTHHGCHGCHTPGHKH